MNNLKETMIGIDFNDKKYEGYIRTDYYWNGWCCPYFTMETCEKILNDYFNKINKFTWADEDNTIIYDSDKDEFVECLDYGINTIGSTRIINGVKYYNLGAMNWCWEETE